MGQGEKVSCQFQRSLCKLIKYHKNGGYFYIEILTLSLGMIYVDKEWNFSNEEEGSKSGVCLAMSPF